MEFNGSQAIYLQIADLLCENILKGIWKPAERIPSVREMAVNVEVNPNTMMRTYSYLQEQEIIYNKRGIGYFVSEDGLEKTLTLRKEDFVTNKLPGIFKEMELLKLSLEDLRAYYDKHDENANKI